MDIILNKEQNNALELIQNYINTPYKERKNPFITISGLGGSGKTSMIKYALKPYIKSHSIFGSAISNSATHELSSSLYFAKAVTITKLLNHKKVINKVDGSYDFKITKASVNNMPIQKADIIVIDECSMIDEELLSDIIKYKQDKAVLIFLGDVAQLKPINHDGLYSPVFEEKNKGLFLELKINMRAKEPLDELNNELRNEILFYYKYESFGKPWLVEDKIVFDNVELIKEDITSGYYMLHNQFEMIDKFTELYLKEKDNPLNIKIVAYTNKTIDRLNDEIRANLYGETEFYFNEGDNVLSNSFYNDNDNIIKNNQYLIVKSVRSEIDKHDIEVLILNLEDSEENTLYDVKCINPQKGYKQYMIRKNQKFKQAQRRIITFTEYNDFISSYANLSYGYVITAYKVQGQTLTNVIVYEEEIKNVKPISYIDKLRSIYVGTSRAKEKIFML